jgi:hypothetical protein
MSFLKLTIVTTALAFGASSSPMANRFISTQPKPVVSNAWKGSSEDLSVDLRFEQAGDSLYARGVYNVAPRKRVGCGGETLYSTGRFTMRAYGTTKSFRGKLLFDTGWTPPVTATRTNPTTIRVKIRSVDKGTCLLTLHRVEHAGPLPRPVL